VSSKKKQLVDLRIFSQIVKVGIQESGQTINVPRFVTWVISLQYNNNKDFY